MLSFEQACSQKNTWVGQAHLKFIISRIGFTRIQNNDAYSNA